MRLFVFNNLMFLVAISILSMPAHAESQQNKQNKIQKQISREKSKLVTARETSEKLHKDVLSAERKLNESSRQLHNTEQKINKLATKLNKSNALKQKLLQQTDQEKNAIAQQMQALYTSGKQSHLRLLLKQDDPSDYKPYSKIFRIHESTPLETLDKVQTVQSQINTDTADLTKLQKKQGATKKELKLAAALREKSYKKQRKKLLTQEQKVKKLKREESRLQGVIARLAAKQAQAEKKRDREKAKRLMIGSLLGIALTSSMDVFAYKNTNAKKRATLPLEQLKQFSEVYTRVKHDYVEEVDDKKLITDAIRGMLTGLDPHSDYLDEEAFTELRVGTSGEFGGLGIEVGMENGFVKVISPIDDTPLKKAGLKPGDLIIRLDDKQVKGLTLNEAVKIMRGKPGRTHSNYRLFVKVKAKPLKITIVRAYHQSKKCKATLP
ncbi:Carboxy-terminal-processing protease [Nymphon striatum]|nr:Carboxy-terminal-processing protease [Nymphon striatum]